MEMIRKVVRWGGRWRGGKCYIPEKFVGKYAYIKIIGEEEIKEYKKIMRELFITKREEYKIKVRKRKKEEEKLNKHLNKLKKIKNGHL